MTVFLTLVLWTAANAGPTPCSAANGATAAAACKCGHPFVESAFDESSTVFSGVVLEVRDVLRPIETGPARIDSAGNSDVLVSRIWEQAVTLRATRGWKGAQPGDTITVWDAYVCGVTFRPGEEYLVYAYPREDGALFTSPCLRTRIINPSDGVHYLHLRPPGEDMRMLDSIIRARRP